MPLIPRPATTAGAARTRAPAFLRFVLPLLLLFAASLAGAAEIMGLVVNVADGDTITVLDSSLARHKVRLEGIDAPERHQAFGARSKQNLAALVQGRSVTVIWHKHDRYGRILGRVLAAECERGACPMTLDTGLAQLNAGLAWHYRQYAREQEPAERSRYAAAVGLSPQGAHCGYGFRPDGNVDVSSSSIRMGVMENRYKRPASRPKLPSVPGREPLARADHE